MVVAKITHLITVPDDCESCGYYAIFPHPHKGWTEVCELCNQCIDYDQKDGWIYDGNGRPMNCPLMYVDDSNNKLGDETND